MRLIEKEIFCKYCGEEHLPDDEYHLFGKCKKDLHEAEEKGFESISQLHKFKEAEKILQEFSKSGIKSLTRKDNSELLDTKAFREMPEVKEVIKQLQDAGVKDSSELGDLGFVPACLILRFGFDK